MGTALPMVSNMMIETVVAQKRAENFAVAETSAVSYAASAQDKYTLPDVPDGCELTLIQDRTYNATCMHGENTLRQSVTRAFTLLDEIASSLTVTTDDNLDGFDDTTGRLPITSSVTQAGLELGHLKTTVSWVDLL